MTNTLAAVALLLSSMAQAHAPEIEALAFDQRIANCENKWFGAKGSDGKVVLGYVYIDPSAGFTFEHYGYLVDSNGALQATKSDLYDKARFITRIGQNFPASCLADSQVEALGLPSQPESMKFYKDDRPLAEHHASWAYHYNHIGASDIALDHVAKAVSAGNSSSGLTFEHAYALNALGRFDETMSLLAPVVASSAKNSDLIAELAYAYLMQGQYQKAIEFYKQAINHKQGAPSQRRWEFARNIVAAYEQLGDIKERDSWIKISDRYREGGR